MRSTTRIALALCAATGLLAGACSSDGDSSEETEDSEGDEAGLEARPTPISEFLGIEADFDPAAAQERYIAEERERQQIIAECMREQGFEYIPVDTSETVSFETGDGGLEYGSKEWIAKYGFGVTTQWFAQSAVGPDLVGYDDTDIAAMEDSAEADPNTAIVEAMSDSEREAYYAALYGDEEDFAVADETLSDEELEAELEDLTWEPLGCEGEAFTTVSGGTGANAFYQEFQDELQEMYERIESDPRLVEVEQQTEACVADKGLTYVDPNDYWSEVEGELNSLQEGVYPGDSLSDEEVAELSEEELSEAFAPQELSAEAKTRLAELQAAEIELAVAVDECGGGWANNRDLYHEIQVEHEQQFLDEHADELAPYEPS